MPPLVGGENCLCGGVEGGAGLFMRGSPKRVILVSSIFSTGLLGKKPPGGGLGLCPEPGPGLGLKGALTDSFLWVMGLAGATGGGARGGGGLNVGGGDLTERNPTGKPAFLSLLLLLLDDAILECEFQRF